MNSDYNNTIYRQMEPVMMTFNIKNIYTNQSYKYTCNSNMTIRAFITNVLLTYIDVHNFKEVVEAGQYNNENGWAPEKAPALKPSDDITLHKKYGFYYEQVSFYLR